MAMGDGSWVTKDDPFPSLMLTVFGTHTRTDARTKDRDKTLCPGHTTLSGSIKQICLKRPALSSRAVTFQGRSDGGIMGYIYTQIISPLVNFYGVEVTSERLLIIEY